MTEQQTLTFDAPSDEPVAIYLASGLTALNDDQLTVVELVSGLVAGFCSEANVMVHQPVLHTHPKDHAALSPEEVHAKDFQRVIDSDAIVAIGDFASWGAGKELVWAERLRMPVLMLLREGRQMSRLVTGTTGDIEIAQWRFHDDIREAWTTYFTRRKAQLEAHRRLRTGRQQLWMPTLITIRSAFDGLNEDEQVEVAAIAHLGMRRIRELLSGPVAIAEASADELQSFANALGLPSTVTTAGPQPQSLPPRALSALATASELEGWDGRHAVELLQRAKTELARGGIRRLTFNEPGDWVDLDRG